ncbi:FAD-binding oxidoreductase [Aquimarina sp. AD10]|uniref:PepSY domain-containing protein n=1 Tax=Aquimarina sp. AD10 TaxID=1714849 RepID=UPI000E49E88D|nr:PepSY domain-containing protein [Aquimarina sp. AD10]AXT62670.1 FAD-binding oxidoreductase [Aquimarina sp. AD10]RKM98335.1 FAD-binding oxidoreductase [Aquimarina sp. AD10]
MTISIWRYSHLALAISSSLFLSIASITGIILALEPISDSLYSNNIEDGKDLTLAETIATLHNNFAEVINFEIDANDAMIASVITKNGNSETIYVNPITGETLGKPKEKAAIFKFATNLHRSLFLKSIGRFFVGFISLLLIIIAVTGIVLILKRQGGIKYFFSKIENDYFAQYYHVVLGRLFLLPILIIAVTGVYLSLEKFSIVPKTAITHQLDIDDSRPPNKIAIRDFEVFRSIMLGNVRSVEFPFSNAIEDYFVIKLSNKELVVNQFNGEIISSKPYPFMAFISLWSLSLHTGQGNVIWSFILLIASCSILFFMYSGFMLSLKRKRSSSINNFKYKKHESEYIILVGSETGSTFTFANLFAEALSSSGKKVFVSELNNYSLYKNARHLIIFTATYGIGEPPTNARKFNHIFNTISPLNKLQFSIVGLGSLAYPHFCKFALDLDTLLKTNSKFESILEPYKINNQSFTDFKAWVSAWSKQTGIPLQIKDSIKQHTTKSENFNVIERSKINNDQTFLLRLQPQNDIQFESGDLLAFFPEEDNIERLYSIGRIHGEIVLAIKKHEFGICSRYLSKLHPGDTIKASIKQNPDFHFPNTKKEMIMIANGTGIAPFLGMLANKENKTNTHLIFGCRTKDSIKMYDNYITKGILTKKIASLHLCYSQEQKEKIYVQDILKKKPHLIARILHNKGIIMICGSTTMQKEVLKTLEIISETELCVPLSNFQKKNQIKMDCY